MSVRMLPSQCLRCSSGLRAAVIAFERSMKPPIEPAYHDTVTVASG